MSKKKSLIASFATLSTEVADKGNADETKNKQSAPPAKRTAAGVIGATQKTLSELREERDRLEAQLADGSGGLISIDPQIIDPSPVRDRLSDDSDAAFNQLKSTIAEQGQKSPILVRQHPDDVERFQVVFGHRRLRAATELEISVLCQVVDYSDHDLIMAQGIENAARQDLSWIERALFASEMQAAGIKAKDIKAALSVDDAQMSKFRAVTSALSISTIERIGRAPSVGRPRWLQLISLITDPSDLRLVEETLSDDKVLKASSDDRFNSVMLALTGRGSIKAAAKSNQRSLPFGDGGKAELSGDRVTLSVPKSDSALFHRFMADEINALEQRFQRFKKAQVN